MALKEKAGRKLDMEIERRQRRGGKRTELERKYREVMRALAESERRYRSLEEASWRNDEQFRKMADNFQAGLTVIGQDGIVYINDRACEIFGYPRKELMALEDLDLVVPEEKQRLHRIIEDVRRTGNQPPELDFWIVRKDGVRRWVRSRCSLRLEEGEITSCFIVTTDITEHKEAEEALRISNERYRTLVENIDLGITLIDRDHTVVMANRAQGRMFGKPVRTFVGKKCFREFEKRDAVCPHCPGARYGQRPGRRGRDGRQERQRQPISYQTPGISDL